TYRSPPTPIGTGSNSRFNTYTWVFAIGLPMATLSKFGVCVSRNQVASADTSDEPYKLRSTLFGIVALNKSSVSMGRASPLVIHKFKCGRDVPNCKHVFKIARSREGTTTIRVTLWTCSTAISLLTSFTTSLEMTTTGTPMHKGANNSAIESTNPIEVFWQPISPSPKG